MLLLVRHRKHGCLCVQEADNHDGLRVQGCAFERPLVICSLSLVSICEGDEEGQSEGYRCLRHLSVSVLYVHPLSIGKKAQDIIHRKVLV